MATDVAQLIQHGTLNLRVAEFKSHVGQRIPAVGLDDPRVPFQRDNDRSAITFEAPLFTTLGK